MTASIVFEAVDTDGATVGAGSSYTFSLTVAAAAGAGRLVFLSGIFDTASGDFSAVTIDGQTATRVASRVVGATTDPVVMTAYLAPGTANTAINVVATVSGSSVFSGMCALYTLHDVDTLYDSTGNNAFDPDLSVDTVAGGVVAAATYGYDASVPRTTAWTGLTENFDSITVYASDIFSGASANIASASTPLTVTSDTSGTFNSSAVGLALSFSPLSGGGEHACLANDVVSASSVTQPAAVIGRTALANDVISASFVSTPTLVVEGEVIPVPPEVGGGGKVYGRGFPRRRWEELLRQLEKERQAALEKVDTFAGEKGKARAYKAAVAASEAIAEAIKEQEVEEQAAAVAHAEEIIRLLEDATRAKKLVDYLALMKQAREAAIEMEDENDDEDEAILLLVA